MKGLLIKDFKMLKAYKGTFLFVILIVGASFMNGGYAFSLFFVPYLFSQLALGTIKTEEIDNSTAFLFTLPISRQQYVKEKYCLTFILIGSGLGVEMLLQVKYNLQNGRALADFIKDTLIILMSLAILEAILIPLQLKFSGDKGRIIFTALFGGLLPIGVFVTQQLTSRETDIENITADLPIMSDGTLLLILSIVSIISIILSLKISFLIMKKKEF